MENKFLSRWLQLEANEKQPRYMNNLIEIKPKTMQIILILLTFIFSHGVKSDQLKTNCGIKFNNLVCMNLDLNNNIKLNLLDEPYRIIIDFEKPISFKSCFLNKYKFVFKSLELSRICFFEPGHLGVCVLVVLFETCEVF